MTMTRKQEIIAEAKAKIESGEINYKSASTAIPLLEAADESYFTNEPTWDADMFVFVNMVEE
jgi:hypothetical protein